jgi:hypothetical protein
VGSDELKPCAGWILVWERVLLMGAGGTPPVVSWAERDYSQWGNHQTVVEVMNDDGVRGDRL